MSVSQWAQSLAAFGSAAAVVAAGGFAAFKYKQQRQSYPRIELATNVEFIGTQSGYWLAQLKANLRNIGLVRAEFHEATYWLSCVYEEDKFEFPDETQIHYRPDFPHKLQESGSWLGATSTFSYNFGFLEPGTSCVLFQDVLIPTRTTFVCLESLFVYTLGDASNEGDGERRVFRVPAQEEWTARPEADRLGAS